MSSLGVPAAPYITEFVLFIEASGGEVEAEIVWKSKAVRLGSSSRI